MITILKAPSGKLSKPPERSSSAVPKPVSDVGAPGEKAGDRIGRYKLMQQIGEGDCGVVYMAEQEEPVRRRVALKVIKLGWTPRASSRGSKWSGRPWP